MKRLFAAIKVHPDENFLKIYYGLKNLCKYDKINWVKPENIHITLKFFGETAEDRIEPILSELNNISNLHQSFRLHLSDVGIFGSYYKPRVIWFGIEKSMELESLAVEVINKMHNIGFLKDRQNFVPHLTIGRIKFVDNKERFSKIISNYNESSIQNILISSFYLFESKLSSSGPTYQIIEEFKLKTEESM
jgi:2'-5' RNA ligase